MRGYWAILVKDLRLEARTRQTIGSTVVFSILVLLIFNFSFDLKAADLVTLGPGVLWSTFIFAGVLVLGRAFTTERENDTIVGLALAPVDRAIIFAAKWSVSALFMLFAELCVLIIYAAMFDSGVFSPLILLDVLLSTIGFTAVGTSLAVVAFNSRAREVMLPVLLLPLTVPVIIAAVRITALVLSGATTRDVLPWLNLLGAFDLLFGSVCYYTFGSLLEE